MLFANSNFKDVLVDGALFNSGIEIQCVSEHVWVRRGELRGQGGELPAGGIRASQGTFSSCVYICLQARNLRDHIHQEAYFIIYSPLNWKLKQFYQVYQFSLGNSKYIHVNL